MQGTIVGAATRIPTRNGSRPYINFDNAASTPPLVPVMEIVNSFVPWYSSVHRGNGLKSRLSTAAYEQAREVVGRFVRANPKEHVVIFGKNTTEAINKLAWRLRLHKKDIVLISNLEHHSNDLPWRARATVRRIRTDESGRISPAHFTQLLKRYNDRVKLVALSGASNVTGHMADIHWFAAQTHKAGAQILVDCAQLAAHRPIDIKSLEDPEHLDYIAFSAHKMYAPFGTGALIGRRDTFDRGVPEYSGGGTIESVTTKTVDWARPPESEEAGSSNVIGAVAMARAAQTLEQIGMKAIASHEMKLLTYALAKLKKIPGLRLYGDPNIATATRTAVIPFTVTGVPSHLVAAVLGFEYGIGVRSGCFCAQPYVMSLLGLDNAAAQRVRASILHRRRDLTPGMVRVSFGLYNTTEEIDALAEALQAIARQDFDSYLLNKTTGQYTPANTKDDFSAYFRL